MIKNTIASLLLALCCATTAMAQAPTDTKLANLDLSTDTLEMRERFSPVLYENEYSFGFMANAGNSELAPYYISSNCGGVITQQYSALVNASLYHNMNMDQRFSWGAGLEVWGGYASSAGYERYKGNDEFEILKQHPARVWIQQAYVEAKYRSIFAEAGQAYKTSPIVDASVEQQFTASRGSACRFHRLPEYPVH